MFRRSALALLILTPLSAQAAIFPVPREKVSLVCTDNYFKTDRVNFVLQDEDYGGCTLKLPLALRDRWPGRRTYFVLPRVSARLLVRDDKGKGQWLPLAPLVNPGADPLHLAVESKGYKELILQGRFGKLSTLAGERVPDTVSTEGKLTVCAAPLRTGEDPCATFDLTAHFKVYKR
ncbi:hypothetical protein [Deinococcus sp.]|uniref:hypothetical protein n=1 Tax=Deinococcus sp. TaxID=47478 RepID=UPI0025E96338|nr:hypothetical protein [Deinococcus sp.]